MAVTTLSHCRSFTKVVRHHLLYHLPIIPDPNSWCSWPILVGAVQQSRFAANPISWLPSVTITTISCHRFFMKVARHHLLCHLPKYPTQTAGVCGQFWLEHSSSREHHDIQAVV
ncbi:unnamed protein product [Prunus brigantina]